MITGWSFYVAFVVPVDFAADLICLFNQSQYFSFKTKKAKWNTKWNETFLYLYATVTQAIQTGEQRLPVTLQLILLNNSTVFCDINFGDNFSLSSLCTFEYYYRLKNHNKYIRLTQLNKMAS